MPRAERHSILVPTLRVGTQLSPLCGANLLAKSLRRRSTIRAAERHSAIPTRSVGTRSAFFPGRRRWRLPIRLHRSRPLDFHLATELAFEHLHAPPCTPQIHFRVF